MNRLLLALAIAAVVCGFASLSAAVLAGDMFKAVMFGIAGISFGVTAVAKAVQLRKAGTR